MVHSKRLLKIKKLEVDKQWSNKFRLLSSTQSLYFSNLKCKEEEMSLFCCKSLTFKQEIDSIYLSLSAGKIKVMEQLPKKTNIHAVLN